MIKGSKPSMADVEGHSPHVQQRYREYLRDEWREHRIYQFWDYVREVGKERPDIKTCSPEKLVAEHECSILDSTRYSRPPLYPHPDERERLSECNFIIMAYASDRALEVQAEIIRRIKGRRR